MTAYKDFLTKLAANYNPTSGSPNGKLVSPYIAYVRPGITEGGENQLFCSVMNNGGIPQVGWRANTQIPAGTIVNTGTNGLGGTQYVAIGGGKTGSSMPTCSTPGCTTGPDGSGGTAVPGWFNTGTWPAPGSTTGVPVWPGPQGQANERSVFSDNGYLSYWNSTDGTGYFTSMMNFLKSLNASFPWDVSSHVGPPQNTNTAYADSQAIIASANGIGFGMESVSVADTTLNAGNYPTTSADWAYNFATYSAPVHHLQDFHPGAPYQAARYPITSISVVAGGGNNLPNTATITCPVDCGWYQNGPIYISGNTEFNSQNQNQIQFANACPNNTCLILTQLAFYTSAPTTNGSPYTGGTVWAPDYWPTVIPFATLQGATSFEVPQCDLDYAYLTFESAGTGLYQPVNQTAIWVPNDQQYPGGCADWGIPGNDNNYSGAIANALNY
jgi:hypothetical protein